MGYQEIINIEISCDFPECDEYILFSYEGWEKIGKMIRAIGWTHIDFPGENENTPEALDFCADCKNKDPDLIKNHNCVFIRKTKKGDVSFYGHTLECYFCGRKKNR